MEKTVLSKEEVVELKEIQDTQNSLLFRLGQIEYQLRNLNSDKESISLELLSSEQKSAKIAKKLEEKYGAGTVNMENGEFIKA
jgi:TolA-binding protein